MPGSARDRQAVYENFPMSTSQKIPTPMQPKVNVGIEMDKIVPLKEPSEKLTQEFKPNQQFVSQIDSTEYKIG